jgi:peptidyl-prolyl cis-trans isomerase C
VRFQLILFAVTLTVACNRTPAASQAAQAAAAQPTGTSTPASPAPQAQAPGASEPAKPVPAALPDVIARVNGETLAKGELERAIKNVEARAGRPVPAEQRDRVYRGVLNDLIAFKLVLAEAKLRGIGVTPEEISGRIATIRKQFPTEAAFAEALKSRGMTVADLEDEARTELVVNKTVEAEVTSKIDVTPQDLETFYKENPQQFQEQESVRASHILFQVDKNAAPAAKDAVRAEAEAVLKRAKAGEDFAALAKQYSKDSSASQGGDLNFFRRGQMVPPFEQAAFALKVGEVSDLVESDFGLHIIKVTDKKPGRQVPLAEVSDRLSQFLKQRKQQAATDAFLEGLRAKYKVEVLI